MAKDLEIFEIFDSGEYEMVKDGNSLKEAMKENNVYLILSHDMKICWIWIGNKCDNVRKKFASARVSRIILSDRQLAYNVKTVDSGSEPILFKEILNQPIRKSYRTEGPTLEHLKIQKMVLENKLPLDCNREAILINNNFYVAVEVKVMGNIVHKFEQSAFLPEGISNLPENYLTRIFVKYNKVEAIEFFKRNQGSTKIASKESVSPDSTEKQIEHNSKEITEKDPKNLPKEIKKDPVMTSGEQITQKSTKIAEENSKRLIKTDVKTKMKKKAKSPIKNIDE